MIKRIHVENFKSFGKLDLEPQPKVNLLIGRNSSGKNNFYKAISYCFGFDEVTKSKFKSYLTLPSELYYITSANEFSISIDFYEFKLSINEDLNFTEKSIQVLKSFIAHDTIYFNEFDLTKINNGKISYNFNQKKREKNGQNERHYTGSKATRNH
jgi:predicted ATP-dependent endonuclease of OLD family